MDKDKLKKIVRIANKQVKPKIEEEGILDDTFNIPDKKGGPMGNGEIHVVGTSDKIGRQTTNGRQRWPGFATYFSGLYEDSIFGKDDDLHGELDGDLIDDTHFDNDDLISSIENIIKIINTEPKKLKNMFNLFVQLIDNLQIDELPIEARQKLCKKIIRKDSRLIDNF